MRRNIIETTTQTQTTGNEFLNRQLELLNQNPGVQPNPIFPGTGRTIQAVPQLRGEWDTRGENIYTRDPLGNGDNEIIIDGPRILNDIGDGILDATVRLMHNPVLNNYANRIIHTDGLTPEQQLEERANALINQINIAFNRADIANPVNDHLAQIINNPTFIRIGDIMTPLMTQGRENLIAGLRQNINLAELMQQVHAHIQAAQHFRIGPIEFYRGFHRVNWGQTRINLEENINQVNVFMQDIMQALFYAGEDIVRGLMELIQYNPIMTIIVLLIQYPLFLSAYFPFQIIDRISIEQLTRLFRRAVHNVMYRINQIRLGMNLQQVIDRRINNIIIANDEIINETRVQLRNNINQTVQGNNADVVRTNLANTNTFLQNIVNGVGRFAHFFTGTNIGRTILMNGLLFLATNYPQLVDTWGNIWRTVTTRLPNIPVIQPPRGLPIQDLSRPPAAEIAPRDLEDQTTVGLIDTLINVGREIIRRIFR